MPGFHSANGRMAVILHNPYSRCKLQERVAVSLDDAHAELSLQKGKAVTFNSSYEAGLEVAIETLLFLDYLTMIQWLSSNMLQMAFQLILKEG